MQALGGLMTKRDLANYRASIDEPLWSSYKEFDFAFPAPPNGGGFAVAQLLKILEPVDFNQYGPDSWEKYYLIAEAMEIALSDKNAYMGDPNFVDIPMAGLLHPDYVEERRKLINFKEHNEAIGFGDPWKCQEGEPGRLIQHGTSDGGTETTHFTAVDQWGNVAACTSSIERMFGSGIMVPEYGFLLNNDLTDFDPEPGTVNEPGAGKYPVSSKTPTIGFHKGNPFFTLGSPGGYTIVASVLQVLVNVLEYKMDLKEAVRKPRLFNGPSHPVQVETEIGQEIRGKLESMGFEVEKAESPDIRIGDVQAILIDPSTGNLYGTADSSRPGAAMGLSESPDD
ncbi:gamma-glutamyltransferase family protein [Planococcus lenghuensis]|uniref:gamma-glutamyltransferase family protein n=1 Tax=Planococcus lenghuensis TaxID=2213202 RepID=UPI0022B65E45|nr:gamma-glutamyltransferase [Planococcus lenghuensis]